MGYNIDNDLSKYMSGYLGDNNHLDDPTVLGFRLFIAFNAPDSLLTNGAARSYLLSIGESHRASLLDSFIDELRYITRQSHHFLRSITGLEALYEHASEGFLSFRAHEKIIEISTYEGMDMRVAKVINLYRRIVYDDTYMRWVLPENLRKMGVAIIISEVRKIRSFVESINFGIGSQVVSTTPNAMRLINDNLSVMVFRLIDCEILHHGINQFLATVSNEELTTVDNSIRLSCDVIIEDHRFGFLDNLIELPESSSPYYDAFYTVSGVDKEADEYTKVGSLSAANPGQPITTPSDQPDNGINRLLSGIRGSVVGSAVIDSLSNSDSLSYVTSLFESEKSRFKRYLQPKNILTDVLGIAVDYVDNQIKRALLGQNVFDSSFGSPTSLANVLMGIEQNNESLGEYNVISDSLLPANVAYELGRLTVHDTISSNGGLGIISDLVVDVISQIATIGFISLPSPSDYGSDLGRVQTILNNISTQFDLGGIETSGNINTDINNALGNITLITQTGEELSLSQVVSPNIMKDLVSDLGRVITSDFDSDSLTTRQLQVVNIIKKNTDTSKIEVIKQKMGELISGNFTATSLPGKMLLDSLGVVEVARVLSSPITSTLGYITNNTDAIR